MTLMSGSPISFGCGSCQSINTPGNSQSPSQSGPFKKEYGVDTQPWFDTSIFFDPNANLQKGQTPVFGSTGLRTLSGPGFFNLDASIYRTIKMTERFSLQFRSDWFSATNTPQFSNPDTGLGDRNFGLIKSAGGGRSIDFGAKLIF